MKVHCDEGVATHIGPEPCADIREDTGEASVGESIGQPSSREKYCSPSADVLINAEGAISRAPDRLGVVEDPGMCGSSLDGNREVSGLTCGGIP